jgi:uncharacterized protein DUF4331
MSDHLDGLTAANDPRLDICDVYLFRRTGTVLVMNVNPGGDDGFHHEAVYELKVDTDDDAVEDITFRVTFGDVEDDGQQRATLSVLSGANARDRDAQGAVLARGRTGEPVDGPSGIRFWAGVAAEPFYIEGSVVTAVRTALLEGSELDLSGFDPAAATNLFGDANVHSIVVEVPDGYFLTPEIGFWAAIAVPTDALDDWRQTDRAAIPLVSTLFGFNEADDYNAGHPSADVPLWGAKIESMIASAVKANGTHDDPDGYATGIRSILAPDVLRYRIGGAARFADGQHNGRDLTESSPEEMFGLVLNRQISMALDSSSATGQLRREFPYLGQPLASPATA